MYIKSLTNFGKAFLFKNNSLFIWILNNNVLYLYCQIKTIKIMVTLKEIISQSNCSTPTELKDVVEVSVMHFINCLVHKRYSVDSLNKELRTFFNDESIKADYVDETNENELTDWNLLFGMDTQYKDYHLYGYVDIYVLKHRRSGFDGADFMITEIAIEFE